MKIVTFYPNRNDATCFYRGIGCFSEFDRIDNEVEVIEKDKVSWNELGGIDTVFFQRPFKKSHLEVLKICKMNGKCTIVDYDDLLCDVPEENNFHKLYSDQDYAKVFEDCLNIADGVILSTDYMAKYLKKKNILKHNRYIVIKNAFNHYLVNPDTQFSGYTKLVVWRGSASHSIDFDIYLNQTKKIISENKDFAFLFLGYLPDKNLKTFGNVGHVGSQDPIAYFNFIKNKKPSLFFAPLMDIPFNHAKSSICKMESTYAGCACISNDFEEWNWSGNKDFMFENPMGFYQKMTLCLDKIRNKDEALKTEWEFNYKYVQNNMMLKQRNNERIKFIKSILRGDKINELQK